LTVRSTTTIELSLRHWLQSLMFDPLFELVFNQIMWDLGSVRQDNKLAYSL